DGVDRAPADGAESARIPREHDAIDLGAEEAARLVVGAFERADAPGIPAPAEQRLLVRELLAEQGVHFGFGPVRGADLAPAALDGRRIFFELLFRPGGGQRYARRHQIPPLE